MEVRSDADHHRGHPERFGADGLPEVVRAALQEDVAGFEVDWRFVGQVHVHGTADDDVDVDRARRVPARLVQRHVGVGGLHLDVEQLCARGARLQLEGFGGVPTLVCAGEGPEGAEIAEDCSEMVHFAL